jgi:hypothetical protein
MFVAVGDLILRFGVGDGEWKMFSEIRRWDCCGDIIYQPYFQ